jgi:solute carrier family 45 protein 1/2/4
VGRTNASRSVRQHLHKLNRVCRHGLGAVVAFYLNSTDMSHWFGRLATSQIKAVSVFCAAAFVTAHIITCLSVVEQVHRKPTGRAAGGLEDALQALGSIRSTFKHLSKPIWRILCIQTFGWAALFSLLFYSSTFVAELFLLEHDAGGLGHVPDELAAQATRAGSLALLGQAVVNFVTAIGAPLMVSRGRVGRLASLKARRDSSTSILRSPRRRPLRLSLSRAWMCGQLLLALLMLLSWRATSVWSATVLIALTGIPLTFTLWVPFALVRSFSC